MSAAGAGAPTHHGNNITCFMLLMVHGSVTLTENTLSPLRLQVSAHALNMIGTNIDRDSLDLSEFLARVVCLVSPSNMGYPVMNSSNSQFPNYVEAFKHMVKADPGMNADKVSALLNFYDTRLYSFFDEHIVRQRFDRESRFRARTPDLNQLDMTDKLLTFYPKEMENHDFIARMRTIRNAIGLDWKPHDDYCIGDKLYCPGAYANQCCLYFPERLDGELCKTLKGVWDRFESKSKSSVTKDSITKLASGLNLRFNEDVLTIAFDINSRGVVTNGLWEGITLEQFFRHVSILLMKVFVGVDGFDVNQLMSRTCVVDTACSDFCVRQGGGVLNEVSTLKEVSIISFEENPIGGGGGVTASVSIRDPTDLSHLGFWEYLVQKKQPRAVGEEPRAVVEEPRQRDAKVHPVVKIGIPNELKEFVPCLTSLESTIQKVEPVFDVEGKVKSVVYTYYDGTKEAIEYTPSVARPPTDSMDTVWGSPQIDMMRTLERVATLELEELRLDNEESVSPPRGVDGGGGLGGGLGGGRRWRRTLKKKCMKKCKTKRQQRRLRRCKMTRRMIAKGRGRRRTCVRRL